jgi:hypothetical protein
LGCSGPRPERGKREGGGGLSPGREKRVLSLFLFSGIYFSKSKQNSNLFVK